MFGVAQLLLDKRKPCFADCNCYENGSRDLNCNKYGECSCKTGYIGNYCNQCNETTHHKDHEGKCVCKPLYEGIECEKCSSGLYDFPRCKGENDLNLTFS